MQNNEFEKQVQERMGQIKFTPSAAVWEEVEKNLKQRRKRRIAIIWFFVFLIAAGGSSMAWFYLSPGSNNIANHNASSPEKNSAKDTPSIVNTPDQTITSSPDNKENFKTNDIQEKTPPANITDTETNQASGNSSPVSQKNIVSVPLVSKQKHKNLSSGSALNIETNSPTINKIKDRKSSADVLATVSPVTATENANSLDIDTKVNESAKGTAVKENTLETDSSATQKDSAISLVKTVSVDSVAASTSTVKIKANTKSKWQFGMSVGFGMSDIVNPVSSEKAMAASPPSANLSAPGSSFQNPALYISPSELNAGKNFSLGIAASKKIKKRLSLGVGLQYHYYSTSITVGSPLTNFNSASPDRSNTYMAVGPRVTNFKNKYHYVELPVTMGFQLLKNKPLNFTTGISLGSLIDADVLTYDNSQGLYIEDKSNLNNFQLHVLLGLSWTFGEKSRLPIQFGPVFSYGASNLSDKSVLGSNHLYSFGAGAKIMFRKK